MASAGIASGSRIGRFWRESANAVGASLWFSANCQASTVSFASAGRTTLSRGMARSAASCSIGWWVGPSSPRPIESCVHTHITGSFISAEMRTAPRM